MWKKKVFNISQSAPFDTSVLLESCDGYSGRADQSIICSESKLFLNIFRKINFVFPLALSVLSMSIASAQNVSKGAVPIVELDFDVSMQTSKYQSIIDSPHNQKEMDLSGKQLIEFFRALYEKNKPSMIQPSKELKIPKIIHQIWIGKSVPDEFKRFQDSWRIMHPDWRYKLWTQYDIPSLHMHNEDLVNQSRNPGEISDLMRYEILYRYGGVYLDFDFECLQSLEPLHYLYDFYIGIQPLDSELVQLGIGIIGSIPGHPLLKECIQNVKRTWSTKDKATARTGPIYCTKVFYDVERFQTTCDIAFPSSYFYPLGCNEYVLEKNNWLEQGAFAVHHWAKSWLYPSFRRPEFQTIVNY